MIDCKVYIFLLQVTHKDWEQKKMDVAIILSILLAFIGGKSCSEASESNSTNPTAKFYEVMRAFFISFFYQDNRTLPNVIRRVIKHKKRLM